MGTGKTRILVHQIAKIGGPCLYVTPNTTIENVHNEVKKWSNLSCVVLKGGRAKRVKLLLQDYDVYIINYEALRLLTRDLMMKRFKVMVCDESIKLKCAKTLQSKAAFQIGQTVLYKFIATGTPITNNPLDIFGQYKFLNSFIFGFSFLKFRSQYAIMGGYLNYSIVKWINMEDLQKKIFQCAIRYTKDECLDLPDKLYETAYIDLPEEQARVYKDLKKTFLAEFQGRVVAAPIVLTKLLRFSQITAGFVKAMDEKNIEKEVEFNNNPKVKWLLEFLEDLPKGRKVVVFIRFLREISMISKILTKAEIRHVSMCGETRDRQRVIDNFNNDKAIKVFIGQIQTTGLGINLTSATYVVFMTNSYNYGDRIQAEDRCHRLGQTKNVTYIDVCVRGTIDEVIIKCLHTKKSIADLIVDGRITFEV